MIWCWNNMCTFCRSMDELDVNLFGEDDVVDEVFARRTAKVPRMTHWETRNKFRSRFRFPEFVSERVLALITPYLAEPDPRKSDGLSIRERFVCWYSTLTFNLILCFKCQKTICNQLLINILHNKEQTTVQLICFQRGVPILRYLIALRFFCDGGHYATVGDAHDVSKSSVFKCVHDISDIISEHLYDTYVYMPSDHDLGNDRYNFFDIADYPCVFG